MDLAEADPQVNVRQNLPNDLILELLSWLPPETIVRFRSVCKLWFSMLVDSNFIQLHRSHFGNHLKNDTIGRIAISSGIGAYLQPFVLPDYNNAETSPNRNQIINNLDNSFVSPYNCTLGICNGLLCYAACYAAQGSILLCNPSIHVIIPLPTCSSLMDLSSFETAPTFIGGIGFDQVENDYKVLVIMGGCGIHDRKAIIFSCRSNSWMRFEEPVPIEGHGYTSFFLHGFIHWLNWVTTPNEENRLAVFDVSKEVFGEMKLPFSKIPQNIVMSVLRGQVCAVVRGENNTRSWEVWTMNEYGVDESWAMQYRVNGLQGVTRHSDIPFASFGGYLIYDHLDDEFYSNRSNLFRLGRTCWYRRSNPKLRHQFVKYDPKTGIYSNFCRTLIKEPSVVCVEATLELIDRAVIQGVL